MERCVIRECGNNDDDVYLLRSGLAWLHSFKNARRSVFVVQFFVMRYLFQFVLGILRDSSRGLSTRSTIKSGKFPSRKSKSAALIASRALVQRIQSRWPKHALPSGCGSKESRPSINARK